MKASFYEKLQHDFVMIRYMQDPNTYDQEAYDTTVLSIKEARKKISMHSVPSEKKILLYCIDTLFEILSEGNKQKIFDYADAIHNIPEIYMQKRNLYSFRQELKEFRQKYGEQYFPFIEEVKPRFTKKAPQNKSEFFSPRSDEDFKKLHPVGYWWLVAFGMTAFLLPYLIYMIYIHINPAPNEWPLVLGLIGTFIIGTGLFNIVAAIIHQYLGHLFTVVCFLGGAALTWLSLYLLYR